MPVRDRVKVLLLPIINQISYASSAYVDIKTTIADLSRQLVSFQQPVGGAADERLLAAVRLIAPMTCEGLQLVRVGGPNDGGYVMVNDFEDVDGAISIGVGRDVSWDLDIASRGIPVVLFDPTVRRAPRRVQGARFYRIGLAASAIGPYRSLSGLLSIAGFTSMNLVLKVDIEGGEWESLASVRPVDLAKFKHIVMELHGLDALKVAQDAKPILEVLNRLHQSHIPVHVHANNYGSLTRFNRFWFPNAVEISYIRREPNQKWKPARTLSTSLDSPCDARVPDFDLSGVLEVLEP